jgi:hypothetical protein
MLPALASTIAAL